MYTVTTANPQGHHFRLCYMLTIMTLWAGNVCSDSTRIDHTA